MAQSPRLCQVVIPLVWVVVPPSVRLQVVVPPNAGGGIARSLKFREFEFWAPNLNPFKAYKYPTLSCLEEQELGRKGERILEEKELKKFEKC